VPKALTKQQIEDYARDGFISPVRVLSPNAAAECRRAYEAMEGSEGGVLRGLSRTKFYLRHPWAFRLATEKAILDVVEDLIGPDILLYQNTAWSKNAGEDAYVSWHQDNTYFGHVPCEVLSVWVALTPSKPDGGSMRFLRGSHKLGQLPVKYDLKDNNMLSSGQTADFDPDSFEQVATLLEPGEASIHHAYMIHGSPPNETANRRLGITFVYHSPRLTQLGDIRTSALLVRGEDRYGHFWPEQPPVSADDPKTVARHERCATLYRLKAQELGNRTIARLDHVEA